MGDGLLDLVLIWTGIIALGVFLYVLLDGFDLGDPIRFRAQGRAQHGHEFDRAGLGR